MSFALAYLRPQWRRVALLGLLVLATLGLELASPQIVRRFVDLATARAELDALLLVAGLYVVAALLLQVAAVGEAYVAENVGQRATNDMRADLARHVLHLDPSFHAAHTPGELIERTDGDVATLGNFFSRFVVQILGSALLLVGILVLLSGIDWRVGLVSATATGLGLLAMEALRRGAVPRSAAERQASAELFGVIEERLAGTEDIRANGAVPYVIRRLHERQRELFRRVLAARFWGNLSYQATLLALTAGTVAALAIGVGRLGVGEMTIGTIYLIFAYTTALQRPINQLGRQMQDLQRAGASLGRIASLLAERSAIVDGTGPAPGSGALEVDVDAVTFGYGDEPTLQDVSFRLAPGEVLGLLGRTGSGKSTIARLLFRLYDPQEGAIRLGGRDLRDMPVAELRRRIGIVTQEIQLFHGTVRDNLTFFDPSVPDARIEAILDDLGLCDWLRRMPDGLDTPLAPGGGGLSAGEAQLLAFARVFLRDPGLVVLDEASSRLDPATERALEHAIDWLLAGRTAIVIAHRLATVRRADTILVLEDGRVAELGPRAELEADRDSLFARLLRTGIEKALV